MFDRLKPKIRCFGSIAKTFEFIQCLKNDVHGCWMNLVKVGLLGLMPKLLGTNRWFVDFLLAVHSFQTSLFYRKIALAAQPMAESDKMLFYNALVATEWDKWMRRAEPSVAYMMETLLLLLLLQKSARFFVEWKIEILKLDNLPLKIFWTIGLGRCSK